MEELVVRLGPADIAGLATLIGDGGVGEAETVALQIFREALATRLGSADDLDPVVATAEESPPPRNAIDGAPRTRLATLMANDRARRPTFVVVALVVAVLLLGGYGKKWSWTGFNANGQLWNWMQLLLLPIAIATFPLWLIYADHMSRVRKSALGLAVVAFAAFVAIGYLAPLGWTGFQGNTLWDWLTLILLPVAIAAAAAWPATNRRLRSVHIGIIAALMIGWLVTLIGGYADRWSWTGYPGNTLWDWTNLLLGPLAFSTILIPRAVRWLSGDVARHVAEEEKKREGGGGKP